MTTTSHEHSEDAAGPEDRLDGSSPPVAAAGLVRPGLAILVCGALLAALAGGWSAAVSVALGALLSLANVWVLRGVARRLSRPEAGGAGLAALLPFKLVLVVGAAYSLVHLRAAEPLPLVAGFAALPLGLSLLAVLGGRTPSLSPTVE
jgi:hypothetical protein